MPPLVIVLQENGTVYLPYATPWLLALVTNEEMKDSGFLFKLTCSSLRIR